MQRTPATAYLFDNAQIRLDYRELVGPNGPATLEPRCFDLLAYLIVNRDRVVPKDELLTELFNTLHISESALSRSVMKVRRALKEIGVDPEIVKTIFRVGYRFTGRVEADTTETTSSQKSPARVALLPFVNDSGDDMLAWVELGLLTMVCRSLASSTALNVVPVESLVAILAPLPQSAAVAQSVEALRSALGAAHVVQVIVRAEAPGMFQMDWHLFSADGSDLGGKLTGPQLTTLAARLSEQLAYALSQGASERPRPSGFSDNDFLTAAHARALQAFSEGRGTLALDLIKICRELHPKPRPLQIEVDFIRILTGSDPARAQVLGRELLSTIDAGANELERSDLLIGLADAALFARDWEKCEQYVEQVEEIAEQTVSQDSINRVEELRFEIAFERGELNLARSIARARIARSRDDGNVFALVAALSNLAKLELAKGDWNLGRQLVTEAIGLDQRFMALANARNSLALTSIWRAQLENVVQLLEDTIASARQEKQAILATAALLNLYTAHSELGNSTEALKAIEEARVLIPSSGSGLLSADGHLVDAEIRFGSLEVAYSLSVNALKRLREVPGLHRTFGLYVLGLIAYGAIDEAEAELTYADSQYADAGATMAHFYFLAAHAHLAYRRNDLSRAEDYVRRYIAVRGSLEAAHDGAMNLMWLKLELNDVETARTIAEQVPEHLHNPMRGWICAARLAHAEGSFEDAVRLHRKVVTRAVGRREKSYLDTLSVYYAKSLETVTPQAFPRSLMLPSMI